MTRPRLLIEEWLPARAIGIECMRERGSSSALAPHTYLHVWWARRPLVASRAAVLGSLLPSDFDHESFERLLGFYADGETIAANEELVLAVRESGGQRIANPHGPRAFSAYIPQDDLEQAHKRMVTLWGDSPTIIDPMAGGGSIPFEAARLGINTIAGELNPVACSILEATVDYPFRFNRVFIEKVKKWGREYLNRVRKRMQPFYRYDGEIPPRTYIFARTVPCPDTGHPTPLVPDWHLLKPKGQSNKHVVAVPVNIDKGTGHWEIETRPARDGIPQPTYANGKATSLFTGASISADYIKSHAQLGNLGSRLYTIALKTPRGSS